MRASNLDARIVEYSGQDWFTFTFIGWLQRLFAKRLLPCVEYVLADGQRCSNEREVRPRLGERQEREHRVRLEGYERTFLSGKPSRRRQGYSDQQGAQACEMRKRLKFNDVTSVQFRTSGMIALRFQMAQDPRRRRAELPPAANSGRR
jgi:hypothetical protein